MNNKEFLQRYDSGKPNFTKDETKKMAYGKFGNYVTTIEGTTRRWVQEVETIFEVNGRFFAISWLRGLTEMAEVYEVERKEKVIFTYIRKDTYGND